MERLSAINRTTAEPRFPAMFPAQMAAGREEEARAEAKIVRERHPDFSLETWDAKGMMSYKDAAETQRIVDALRQAGLK